MTIKSNKRRGSLIENDNVKKQKLDLQKPPRKRQKRIQKFRFCTRQENISAIYGFVSTLYEFLEAIAAFNAKGMTGSFSPALIELLNKTIVGVESLERAKEFLRSRLAAFLVEVNSSQATVCLNFNNLLVLIFFSWLERSLRNSSDAPNVRITY